MKVKVNSKEVLGTTICFYHMHEQISEDDKRLIRIKRIIEPTVIRNPPVKAIDVSDMIELFSTMNIIWFEKDGRHMSNGWFFDTFKILRQPGTRIYISRPVSKDGVPYDTPSLTVIPYDKYIKDAWDLPKGESLIIYGEFKDNNGM